MICQFGDGSACGEEASHVLKVKIPAERVPMDRGWSEVMVAIPLCPRHAQEFDAVSLVRQNPRTERAVREALRFGQGKVKPDWDRAEVEPVNMTSKEYRDFMKGQQHEND